MKMKEYVKNQFFERNRVHRLYLGGQSFADFSKRKGSGQLLSRRMDCLDGGSEQFKKL